MVNFLDGEKFRIVSQPGQVIKPDSLMTVPEKGMPFHKNPYRFGNMFVLFKVKFPESLSESQTSDVKKLLNGMANNKKDVNMDVAETVNLIPFSSE